ncbi:ribosomal-protein-alanine N-acetyltransferase [Aliidongia dinghuensis]|uniref:Ribosomal-protein-alanine N-acetyltransferase n=1 Tax=Aliidongia dinghuensis TaxID=1867774 RepID=A0A8J2YT08_9PROT|nr:GNAT family N-acetyltransferase [Aliidongia dinghuensis]GGF16294.1 ribosomal-protein-alanine N-acetyltransferase [Aliidongia dinghuensis]
MSTAAPAAPVPPLTRIETPRLILTLAPLEAAPRVVAYQRENWEHFARWSAPRGSEELSVANWRRRLEQFAADERAGMALRLMLFRDRDLSGPVLGVINFTQIFRGAFQACYLGYAIDYRLEGRGLMREALEAAIRHVFDAMKLHRIMVNYMPSNERSAALARRLGFIPEGIARDYLYIDGAWRDHVLTALTNPAAPKLG